MRALKLLAIIFAGAIGITLIAARSTNAPAAAPVQKTAAELHNEGVQASIAGSRSSRAMPASLPWARSPTSTS